MTTKPIKADDVPLDVAEQVVNREADARKDGVIDARADANGVMQTPDKNDRSVRTYDPQAEPQNPAKPEKSKYKSGELVSDRS